MISGKRAKCSLSKLVTGDIFYVQKLFDAGGGIHPLILPLDPPLVAFMLNFFAPRLFLCSLALGGVDAG